MKNQEIHAILKYESKMYKPSTHPLPLKDSPIVGIDHGKSISEYLANGEPNLPLLLNGDCKDVLAAFPSESVDCVMTSPPYWGQREYHEGGIGLESSAEEYITNILNVTLDIKRVLKSTGSFWLNVGDRYIDKCLKGIPWRIALAMMDGQGWILRNEVIWNKMKGSPDNSKDKLRNLHEQLFHFVKSKNYYYDADSIRLEPKKSKIVRGVVVSATGVSGIRYSKQIQHSSSLSDKERTAALVALESMLNKVRNGEIADFRMIIRGQQRVTHSDSTKVSGRAKELEEKGFYFLKYHPNGAKPGDVWEIIPEDTQNRILHFSPYPIDLCRMPILSTCPKEGVVVDPFCGTGTTLAAALSMGRYAIGIDISAEYLEITRRRCAF